MVSIEQQVFGGRWAVAERAAKPAWVQIEEQLADRIESGHLAPGERLPAERELALALAVSRMTVRQALASLAARGLVERGVGRGTFVRDVPKVVHDLTRVAGFTEEVERAGPRGGRADPRAPASTRRRAQVAAGARHRRGRAGRAARARAARRRPAADARGHLGAGRALPRPARARPLRLALRADARALRPRAGAARPSGWSRSPRRSHEARAARRAGGLAADARRARRLRRGRHAGRVRAATATAATARAS